MTTLKQSLKKYCIEASSLPALVDAMNLFFEQHPVAEIQDYNYFQEQTGDSIDTTERQGMDDISKLTRKITNTKYSWKYMVIITLLKEENVERRLS
jgi:hypothetical protein